MLGCALIPRLSLVAAVAGRREMLGRPVALAPEPGGPQVIGESSGAAEAFGVHSGMRLAEALARCPSLVLIPPSPARAEAIWERSLRRLEAIGAAVEPGRAGEAYFSIASLRGLYGSPGSVLRRGRRALGAPARLAAGPTRLCAYAAALRARASRSAPVIWGEAASRMVADLPVAILGGRLASGELPTGRRSTIVAAGGELPSARSPSREAEEVAVVDSLERLGVKTLGELAALPPEALADRFGESGLRALRIARGIEVPLRPRQPPEELAEQLELPEAASGIQLEHALELLIDRLLANPARRGRSFRRLRLEARLEGGGDWRVAAALRDPCTDRRRLQAALTTKLSRLPGPARVLGLRALETGPRPSDQRRLTRQIGDERRDRIAEAIRQAQAAAGRDALLRVVEVEPGSRVPERRALLTPLPEPGSQR